MHSHRRRTMHSILPISDCPRPPVASLCREEGSHTLSCLEWDRVVDSRCLLFPDKRLQVTQKLKGHRCQEETGLVYAGDTQYRQSPELRNRHASVKCGHYRHASWCSLTEDLWHERCSAQGYSYPDCHTLYLPCLPQKSQERRGDPTAGKAKLRALETPSHNSLHSFHSPEQTRKLRHTCFVCFAFSESWKSQLGLAEHSRPSCLRRPSVFIIKTFTPPLSPSIPHCSVW